MQATFDFDRQKSIEASKENVYEIEDEDEDLALFQTCRDFFQKELN